MSHRGSCIVLVSLGQETQCVLCFWGDSFCRHYQGCSDGGKTFLFLETYKAKSFIFTIFSPHSFALTGLAGKKLLWCVVFNWQCGDRQVQLGGVVG